MRNNDDLGVDDLAFLPMRRETYYIVSFDLAYFGSAGGSLIEISDDGIRYIAGQVFSLDPRDKKRGRNTRIALVIEMLKLWVDDILKNYQIDFMCAETHKILPSDRLHPVFVSTPPTKMTKMIRDFLEEFDGYVIDLIHVQGVRRLFVYDPLAGKVEVAENMGWMLSVEGDKSVLEDILKRQHNDAVTQTSLAKELVFETNFHHITDSIAVGVAGAYRAMLIRRPEQYRIVF